MTLPNAACGTCSDVEVMRGGIRTGPDQLAGALAHQPIITVESSTPLREAGELMLARGVSPPLAIDPRQQRPIGILSTPDIAGVLAWAEA